MECSVSLENNNSHIKRQNDLDVTLFDAIKKTENE